MEILKKIKTYVNYFYELLFLNIKDKDPINIKICKEILYDKFCFINRINVYDEFINLTVENKEMEDRVISIAEKNGWVCTRRHNFTVNIEPLKMQECTISHILGNPTFYHVSLRSHRISILKSGILPQNGGNTRLKRNYSSRVHIFSNLSSALSFANYQTKPISGKDINDIDIYRVEILPNTKIYKDYLVPDCGFWTESPFLPSQVILIENKEWRSIYDALYPQILF